jgi:hypothetical protein
VIATYLQVYDDRAEKAKIGKPDPKGEEAMRNAR